ncbi:MAG: thioesterase family protein [Arenimonas sp.]|nr:thioesterase family protein [Arenimonas sp.]
MSVHPLDRATALAHAGGHVFAGRTDPDWANMVGPYGGISAAQKLAAVLAHPQRLGEPVALTVNYAAAVADGTFAIEAVPVRTNRSTQHWQLTMRQGDAVVLTGTAFTALRRESFRHVEHAMPQVPPPDQVPLAEGPKRVAWLHRYGLRFVEGGIPARWDGADQGDSRTRLWMRDEPPRPLDFTALAALADVFFPRVWRRRATLIPVGTVSITVYFHADGAQLARVGTGWVLGQAQGQGFGLGYFDHAGQLWAEDGTLLATTHQVVYMKE